MALLKHRQLLTSFLRLIVYAKLEVLESLRRTLKPVSWSTEMAMAILRQEKEKLGSYGYEVQTS